VKSRTLICIAAMTLSAALAIPVGLRFAAQEHLRYKLVVIGTLGGPQSFGDAGHNAANINSKGIAAGVADTSIPDPFYPLYNPGFASLIGLDRYIYHGLLARGSTLIDLGGLPGGTDSTVSYLTENELVSGQALDGSIDPIFGWQASKAVAWIDGKIINLGTLGGYESAAGRMNSRGQVTGYATNAVSDPFSIIYFLFRDVSNGTQTRAFLWDEKEGMQDIGTLGGPDAFAPYINERGQIAGFSYTNSTPNSTTGVPTLDPFLWENGRMIDLGTLGGTNGGAGDLNNRGQVIGTSSLAGDVFFHPFLWTAPGPMHDLGTLGGATGVANAINDTGEVVGYADTPTSTHAYVWTHGKMTDLGTLDGDCFSVAFGINAHTQIVGQSITCDFAGFRAFLWDGHIIDLNVFVPAGLGLTLNEVEQINDRGEVFGIGTLANGDLRAFLLLPVGDDDPEGISATPENLSALAARTAQLSASATGARKTQREMLAGWRARLTQRYHVPGPGTGLTN
jgi:probable HAF family extracellular repeat protein